MDLGETTTNSETPFTPLLLAKIQAPMFRPNMRPICFFLFNRKQRIASHTISNQLLTNKTKRKINSLFFFVFFYKPKNYMCHLIYS